MQQFADEVTLTIVSGHGGAGSASFRREKYVPRGGPDGGDGGRGGDVVFRCQDGLKTLSHLRSHATYRAGSGTAGAGRNKHGKDGADVVLEVPAGTQIRRLEDNEILGDLTEVGQELRILAGGRGGKGNTHFATSTNRAPRFAQPGAPGESLQVVVELRLIADVGFVGFPNAGKSSLLAALTSAQPKVGAYPFTTTAPHLGVLRVGYEDLVVADIPGLIEGASRGAGLGIRFLRHITRTRCLCFVVDLSTGELQASLDTLRTELGAYSPELLNRPRIIVASKADLPEVQEALTALQDEDVLPVSSFTGEGIAQLAERLSGMVHG